MTLLCYVAAAVEPLSASVIIYGHGKLFTRICWRPQHSDTVDINALQLKVCDKLILILFYQQMPDSHFHPDNKIILKNVKFSG